jgi:hypothetical protein
MTRCCRTVSIVLLATFLAASAWASWPVAVGMYHEIRCPSVDRTRMTRVKRVAAVEMGLVPAPDCHPDARVRYLGTTWWPTPSLESMEERRVQVRAYDHADGTHVGAHTRSMPKHGD